MGGVQGMKLKQRKNPTDLFCRYCLQQVILLENVPFKPYKCERCIWRYSRTEVLTFNEMIGKKFERVKQRNLNQLKRDMRP
jgi:hypothetical protein